MIIPGFLIAIITFPGVIVHELAHQIFCRIRRVPVYEVKYFQFANPCGYVVHEPSDNPLTTFIIAIGPFIVNTLLGALILMPVSIEIMEFGGMRFELISDVLFIPKLICFWLGISIVMHAFPSTGDAKVLITNIMKNSDVNIFIKILVAPFIGLIYLGAVGSIIWLDLGYAIGIAVLMPQLIALFL
ncbi:MAG: metalloprotease family protein [Oscillospiraceae bacterium]|jgi:predicted small integral membrane protein|nr:metalloprotease family protein [Oscillospiraceae bacterium]